MKLKNQRGKRLLLQHLLMAWAAVASFVCLSHGQTTATLTIHADAPGAQISSNLFGIFLDEINRSTDGGIYAEMVQNRAFEDATDSIPSWTLVTSGTAVGQMNLDSSLPLSPTNVNSLKLTMSGGSGTVGAANGGYAGIALTQEATYNLAFYARCAAGFNGSMTVALGAASGGAIYASSSVNGLTTNWQRFALPLVPAVTDPSAQLTLSISQPGTVWLDFVSLFPAQTFNNRTNGLRPDLANMLLNLHPSFVRFPGGSWVDGVSLASTYLWESTIGPIIDRPERTNVWGYMVGNGLGYYEYLQLCEDIGAQPLFVVNCGMDVYNDAVATYDLGPWIQEALDAIAYANGGTNTYWGAQRAAAGHPAPFNLQYIEIGNENYGSAYIDNCTMFYNAIKASYPNMNVISDPQVPTVPVELMDQHFYSDPAWFESSATLYDNYSRSGPKVFVGEYSVVFDTGLGNLGGALAEAAFMTGLERNGDIVAMASYAPLFVNAYYTAWLPGAIYFTGTQLYATPSYYVQQMFSLNRGGVVLPTTVAAPANSLYVSSSLVPSSGQIIVKVVNVSSSPVATTFEVLGVSAVLPTAALIQLTSANATDENSLSAPTHVFPVTNVINNAGTNFAVTLPANSLSIFKFQASGFGALAALHLQMASPIHVYQFVTSQVTGQETGQTNLISLAGNYAISYSSANTNVAAVDNNGNITGVNPGTTTIVAAYKGLSATQSVTVLPVLPASMIHRYSFNDGTADDSMGANNGVFYNASGQASIANGQLNLVGNEGDYVDLGPALITTTNIATGAFTLEAWATFHPSNGAFARLFDFGGYFEANVGGPVPQDYFFLAANEASNGGLARLAVGDVYGDVDETGFYVNNFLGQTNFHVVAVFNPAPDRQFLGLYTNGVLAASVSTGNKTIGSLENEFSFLGHSLWPSDAWLNGSIDEFRIYDGELSTNQIAATQLLGPNQPLNVARPVLSVVTSNSTLTLSWPLASVGFTLVSATSLNSGTWTNVPVVPQLVSNNTWQVTTPLAKTARFYRLQQ